MNNFCKFLMLPILLGYVSVRAQLAVTVSPPKFIGQKADVAMAMKNEFGQRVISARAVCFLLDEQGKMAGYSTKWVVGGKSNAAGIENGRTNIFHFIITPAKFATNLTARVNFSRVVLENGKQVNPSKDVTIRAEDK